MDGGSETATATAIFLNTHIFELNIPKFSELCNCVMCNFGRHKQLHQAHLFRSYQVENKSKFTRKIRSQQTEQARITVSHDGWLEVPEAREV